MFKLFQNPVSIDDELSRQVEPVHFGGIDGSYENKAAPSTQVVQRHENRSISFKFPSKQANQLHVISPILSVLEHLYFYNVFSIPVSLKMSMELCRASI